MVEVDAATTKNFILSYYHQRLARYGQKCGHQINLTNLAPFLENSSKTAIRLSPRLHTLHVHLSLSLFSDELGSNVCCTSRCGAHQHVGFEALSSTVGQIIELQSQDGNIDFNPFIFKRSA